MKKEQPVSSPVATGITYKEHRGLPQRLRPSRPGRPGPKKTKRRTEIEKPGEWAEYLRNSDYENPQVQPLPHSGTNPGLNEGAYQGDEYSNFQGLNPVGR